MNSSSSCCCCCCCCCCGGGGGGGGGGGSGGCGGGSGDGVIYLLSAWSVAPMVTVLSRIYHQGCCCFCSFLHIINPLWEVLAALPG